MLLFFSTVMLNKAIAKWKLNCIHEVFMFTSFYLQSLRESKWTTNSATPETSFLTNNVASACDELVHSKAVTAVEDKRFCIFIWHIFLVPVKTSFFEHELSSDTCGVTSALPISIDQYMVHGCRSLKFHYREMSNMWLASVRSSVNLQERVF